MSKESKIMLPYKVYPFDIQEFSSPVTRTTLVVAEWLCRAVRRFLFCPNFAFVRCLSAIRKIFDLGGFMLVLQEPERSVHSLSYPCLRGLEHMTVCVQSCSTVAMP